MLCAGQFSNWSSSRKPQGRFAGQGHSKAKAWSHRYTVRQQECMPATSVVNYLWCCLSRAAWNLANQVGPSCFPCLRVQVVIHMWVRPHNSIELSWILFDDLSIMQILASELACFQYVRYIKCECIRRCMRVMLLFPVRSRLLKLSDMSITGIRERSEIFCR